MDTYQFIIGLITAFGVPAGAAWKFHIQNIELKKKIDENQNNEITTLKNSLTELKQIVISLVEEFSEFKKEYNFRHTLRYRIESKAQNIISSNQDINSNFIHLLLKGRDLTIEFAKNIFFRQGELNESILANECSSVFDVLKSISANYFHDERILRGEKLTFAKYLRNYTNINNLTYTLIKNILQWKTGFFNGNSDEKYIIFFENFLTDVYLEGIKAYRNFANLEKA